MRPQIHTYCFGRLNLLTPTDDKHEFLLSALRSGAYETRGKFKYGFFDISRACFEDEIFITGSLVKYKPLLEGEIVDETRREIVGGGLPLGVVAKSPFLLHFASSVIAFKPVTNRLSHRQFRETFADLLEAAHDRFFVTATVESVDEELQVVEALDKMSIISEVSFRVHPTNPSSRKVFTEIDEKLKRMNATEMRHSVAGGEGGLNREVLREDDSYRGLIMAADGYGEGNIQGTIDDQKVVISTEDSPVRKEVVATEDPQGILEQLFSTFRRIWERERR